MKKYEYAGKESNQKYHELTEKYGTDKMIFFCLDYAFEDKKLLYKKGCNSIYGNNHRYCQCR